jgi:hypothetical protein
MEYNVDELAVCWSSGRRILVEAAPSYGLEFRLSPSGKPVLDRYVGVTPENFSSRDAETMKQAAQAFLRRQHGKCRYYAVRSAPPIEQ